MISTLLKRAVYFVVAVVLVLAGYYYIHTKSGSQVAQQVSLQTVQVVQNVANKIDTTLNDTGLTNLGVGSCNKPLTYSLNSFDTRFGLTKAQFLSTANQSASIWNKALGRPLLEYSATGTVKINLIYDYRQQATDQLKQIGITIDNTKSSYDAVKTKYDSMVAAYTQQKTQIDSLVAIFNASSTTYKAEVDYWNSRGGAPPAQYSALQNEKANLDAQVAYINQLQNTFNQNVEVLNATAGILNGLVHTLNLNVQTYNSTSSSTGKEFQEGEYVRDSAGSRIYIYEFEDQDKLLRVLAHEMGHALGLDHVQDPNAIMYYLNEGSNEKLTSADIAELKSVCGIK